MTRAFPPTERLQASERARRGRSQRRAGWKLRGLPDDLVPDNGGSRSSRALGEAARLDFQREPRLVPTPSNGPLIERRLRTLGARLRLHAESSPIRAAGGSHPRPRRASEGRVA